MLGVLLILLSSRGMNSSRSRFPGQSKAAPGRLNGTLYLVVGCFFLVVEAAYFWFDVDVFNASTYR